MDKDERVEKPQAGTDPVPWGLPQPTATLEGLKMALPLAAKPLIPGAP